MYKYRFDALKAAERGTGTSCYRVGTCCVRVSPQSTPAVPV